MGLMKKLTSAVVASSLVLGLVGTAAAAPSSVQLNEAYARLNAYSVVQGKTMADGTVSPALGDSLTRAELVTILARGFGQEETAKLLKGAASFKDVPAAEWYSGYVALVKNIAEQKGTTIGYEDGTFKPAQNVKAIEALAFIMKLLGVKPATGANWVADTIKVAQAAGVITAADVAAYLDAPDAAATRGLAFALADAIFRTYQVTPGKTVYTTYVDTVKPVLTINKPAEPTTVDAAYTVKGKVEGAVAVYFGSEKVTTAADGSFTVEVKLAVGANTVAFSAVDLAGNVTEEKFTLTRAAGAADKVVATVAASVKAGATAPITVKVTDKNGLELKVNAADLKFTVAGEVGTVADGVFTAGTKVTTGTVTVAYGTLTAEAVNVAVVAGDVAKVVADKASIAVGTEAVLTAQDAYGNAITGATFTADGGYLNGNKFTATKAGSYTVTAKVGEATATGKVGVFAAFDNTAKVVIEAAESIVANNSAKVVATVKVVDANGNAITNFPNGSITLTGGGLTITEKTDAAGVATYEIVSPNGLTGQVITLTGTAATGGVSVEGTKAITVAQQVATSISVELPDYLAVNGTDGTLNSAGTNAVVKVLDQNGKPMLTGTYAVSLALTGDSVSFSSSTATATTTVVYVGASHAANGVTATVYPVSLTKVGDVSISATLTGLTAGSDALKTAYAQAESKAVASITTTRTTYKADIDANAQHVAVKVQLVDANNVPVAKAGVEITLDFDVDYTKANIYETNSSGARAQTPVLLAADPVVTTGADGSATYYFESQTFIGTANITAKKTGLTGNTVSAAFVNGDANKVGFVRTAVTVAQGTEKVELSAQLYDAAGNKALVAGKKVYFTADGVRAFVNGGAKATVETDANGVAKVTLTTIGYVDSTAYTASIDLTATELATASADTASVTIANSVATSITAKTQVNSVDDYFVADTDNVTILATVKDARGLKLGNQTVNVVFPKGTVLVTNGALAANGTLNAAELTVAMTGVANSAGDYQLAGVYFAKAPTATFAVKIVTGQADVVYNGSIAVAPAAASAIKVTSADSNNKVAYTKATVSGPYTITLVDKYGNAVYNAGTTDIVVTWSYNNLAAGEYFEIKETAGGPRLAGTATSGLKIAPGASSVQFYVFGNLDQTITFASTGLTSSAATTFDQ